MADVVNSVPTTKTMPSPAVTSKPYQWRRCSPAELSAVAEGPPGHGLGTVNRREAAGENMQYSMHIYREIRWRLNFTLGDAQMYGVSFLRDAGYFDATRRFWTSKNFPGSEAVRGRIRVRLEATGLGDPSLRQAYEDLTGK